MTVRNITNQPVGGGGTDADVRTCAYPIRSAGTLYERLAEVDINRARLRMSALGGSPLVRAWRGWRAIREDRKARAGLWSEPLLGQRVERLASRLNGGVIVAGVRVK